MTTHDVVARVIELRRDFDATFAAPLSGAGVETWDLIAVRVAGVHYAMFVTEIAELAQGHKIVKLPSRRPDVLGIASIRGNLVSVHSLARLLGHGAEEAREPWLAVCADSGGVALAFGELERLVRLRPDEVQRSAEGGARYLAGAVRVEGHARPVVSVRAIVASLQTSAPDPGRNPR
jgi:chemotaxis signal transduction protein